MSGVLRDQHELFLEIEVSQFLTEPELQSLTYVLSVVDTWHIVIDMAPRVRRSEPGDENQEEENKEADRQKLTPSSWRPFLRESPQTIAAKRTSFDPAYDQLSEYTDRIYRLFVQVRKPTGLESLQTQSSDRVGAVVHLTLKMGTPDLSMLMVLSKVFGKAQSDAGSQKL